MKTLMITGGAGSVGKELSIALAKQGYNVTAFDIPKADYSGLEENGIKAIKGDITDFASVKEAVGNVDIVLHLAALLPPVSERSRELSFAVNVQGTKNLVDAIVANGGKSRLIFSSTVATYGDSRQEVPPIGPNSTQRPNTLYSETKIEAEKYILQAGIPYTILRVSGVVLAALMDPPAWPFVADQRVEFVYRADVVRALFAAVEKEESTNKILIVAGGKSWQMLGHEFAEKFLEVLDYPIEDAEYPEKPHYSDWYDTAEAQRILNYQQTSFPQFIEIMQKVVNEAIGV